MRLNIFSFIWFNYLSWWHDCLKLLPLFKKLGNLFSYYCIFEKFYIFCIWGSYICDLQIFSLICNLYFFIPFNKVLNKQKFLMLMVWFIKFFSCDFFKIITLSSYFPEVFQIQILHWGLWSLLSSFCIWSEYGSKFFLLVCLCTCTVGAIPFIGKTFFPSILPLYIFQKLIGHEYVRIYFWTFSSIYVFVHFNANMSQSL